MNRLKYLIIGFLAMALSSCGQTVIEKLNVAETPAYNAPGSGMSIVILPFADYSEGNLESARRRNMVVTESLTDNLVAFGFGLPVQEDVFDYLVAENVIQLSSYKLADTGSLAIELNNDWSDRMKTEIQRYKTQVEEESVRSMATSPGAHGLTQHTVAKIGRHFKADYVLRGRILEFKTRDEATWAPWKKGVLPFVNGAANRILNGFASSDAYDASNEALTGMLLAGALAYNTSTEFPWNRDESTTIFGDSKGQNGNAIIWGGLGHKMGSQLHNSGKVDQAVVQLRIWIQEASSGNVIWTNRVRVLVSPESIFSDKQYDTLFNKAIEKGVGTLMDNFVSHGL